MHNKYFINKRVLAITAFLSLALLIFYPEAFDRGESRTIGTSIIAGLLVGLGTRFGNGCTSGHGICGIGRLSKRSLAATATFLLTGIVTASVLGLFKEGL